MQLRQQRLPSLLQFGLCVHHDRSVPSGFRSSFPETSIRRLDRYLIATVEDTSERLPVSLEDQYAAHTPAYLGRADELPFDPKAHR